MSKYINDTSMGIEITKGISIARRQRTKPWAIPCLEIREMRQNPEKEANEEWLTMEKN